MNKMILLVPAIAASLLVAGCGADAPPAPAADAVPAPAADAATAASVPPANDAVASAYEIPTGMAAGGHCALDAVNGTRAEVVTVAAGGPVMFGGWVADSGMQVPGNALLVLGNGADSYAAPLVAGAPRPDVAQALGSEALANAGFNLQADLSAVAPGRYELGVVVDSAAPAYCDFMMTLVLE